MQFIFFKKPLELYDILLFKSDSKDFYIVPKDFYTQSIQKNLSRFP